MKKKIFVALSTFAENGREPLELLEKSGHPFWLNTTGKRLKADEVVSLGKDCEGIVAGVEPYDETVLERMTNLKCISRCGVGTDNIHKDKARQKGIAVLNTPDVVVQPVAELTLAIILDLLRHLSWHTSRMKAGQWEKKTGGLLAGKNVGIIGLGRIGKRVAEMMMYLGASVCASDVQPDEIWARQKGVAILPADELLKRADVVCLHVSASAKNPFRMTGRDIGLMKPGAVLANLSRGDAVDEAALYSALKEGRLGGAGLDVFPEEPYKGKLCELDNVVLTPHVATLTAESRLQMETEAVKNLLNYFLQRP
ncbi:MAG: phosphoglycerate dehydrogenase [Candidatus Omnitrophota bacterium]|nr:phosphoglycerate dehydrogenase [Candidatus Omnitrophota bacterium]MDZ4241381.1 phosphoglycerate dehydrogenase [Candidatus Omnitrophota bacterium]